MSRFWVTFRHIIIDTTVFQDNDAALQNDYRNSQLSLCIPLNHCLCPCTPPSCRDNHDLAFPLPLKSVPNNDGSIVGKKIGCLFPATGPTLRMQNWISHCGHAPTTIYITECMQSQYTLLWACALAFFRRCERQAEQANSYQAGQHGFKDLKSLIQSRWYSNGAVTMAIVLTLMENQIRSIIHIRVCISSAGIQRSLSHGWRVFLPVYLLGRLDSTPCLIKWDNFAFRRSKWDDV